MGRLCVQKGKEHDRLTLLYIVVGALVLHPPARLFLKTIHVAYRILTLSFGWHQCVGMRIVLLLSLGRDALWRN